MKKSALLITLFVFTYPAFAQDSPPGSIEPAPATSEIHQKIIKVTVDGKAIKFPDAGPERMGGRVMVPIRGVFEAMGATLEWNAGERKVIATRGAKTVTLELGKSMGEVNGVQVHLDQPAQMKKDRVFIPLRFIGESLGATVDWDPENLVVSIKTGEPPVPLFQNK